MLVVVCVLLILVLFSACSRRRTKATVPVSTRPPMPSTIGSTEVGVASWYGHPYHGRRTANGEVYDQEKMTAAHPSLAFNTWVRVSNLDNGLDTTVRINDRGPFVKGRAIDLSRAAAREIAMLGPGTAKVRVVVIDPPAQRNTSRGSTSSASNSAPLARPSPAPGDPITTTPAAGVPPRDSDGTTYAVQFGAFRDYQNALRLRDQVSQFLPDARVVPSPSSPSIWLVLGGSQLGREEANEIVQELSEEFVRIFPVADH